MLEIRHVVQSDSSPKYVFKLSVDETLDKNHIFVTVEEAVKLHSPVVRVCFHLGFVLSGEF